jgi:hypothetical protein
MDRTSAPYATADRKFTGGDPTTGARATFLDPEWHNGVQEELVGLIEAAGLTPAAGTYDQVKKAIYRLIYPVGSIYMTADLAFSPAATFGGTWVKVAVGRVPVGFDSSQTEFNTVGKTGGEKAHTLTRAELPDVSIGNGVADDRNGPFVYGTTTSGMPGSATMNVDESGGSGGRQGLTERLGSGAAHNNLQPYEVVGNIWKRTAL